MHHSIYWMDRWPTVYWCIFVPYDNVSKFSGWFIIVIAITIRFSLYIILHNCLLLKYQEEVKATSCNLTIKIHNVRKNDSSGSENNKSKQYADVLVKHNTKMYLLVGSSVVTGPRSQGGQRWFQLKVLSQRICILDMNTISCIDQKSQLTFKTDVKTDVHTLRLWHCDPESRCNIVTYWTGNYTSSFQYRDTWSI